MIFKHACAVFAVAFSCSAFAETDPCSSLADSITKSDPSVFVGFGSSKNSQQEADQNAQVNLAATIRQRVSSTSTVMENNTSLEVQSLSKSVVSESLIGMTTLRRCARGTDFSTVVSLKKQIFKASLEEKVSANNQKALALSAALQKEQSDELLAQVVEKAKKFLLEYQSNSSEDLSLCHIYQGCSSVVDDQAFVHLASLVAQQADKDQYYFFAKPDEASQTLKESLITLLENTGIRISDDPVMSPDKVSRKIWASCQTSIGSVIPGTLDKVFSTKCTLDGYSGKQKMFHKTYSCKSMKDPSISSSEALNACSNNLSSDK